MPRRTTYALRWRPETQGYAVYAGGAPLIANAKSVAPGLLLRSTDGGATWAALPAFPAGAQAHEGFAFEAPDGSIFIQLQTNAADAADAPATVYVLRAGTSAWTPSFPMGANQFTLAAIAWDAAGHPTTLWALDRESRIWRRAL